MLLENLVADNRGLLHQPTSEASHFRTTLGNQFDLFVDPPAASEILTLQGVFNDLSLCEQMENLRYMKTMMDNQFCCLPNWQDNRVGQVVVGQKFRELVPSAKSSFYQWAMVTVRNSSYSPTSSQGEVSPATSKPLLVDLTLDSSSSAYQDGSDNFPYSTVEAAALAILRGNFLESDQQALTEDIFVVRCGEDCKIQTCVDASCCERHICTRHGTGSAIFRPGMAAPVFDVECCMECNQAACLDHNVCSPCDLCTFQHLQSVKSLDVAISPYRICQRCSHAYQSVASNGAVETFTCCSKCSTRFCLAGLNSVGC